MILRTLSRNILVEKRERELIDTLRKYGAFHISEIGNGIWFANLECRPCMLSPIHATKTTKMEAILRVEHQLKNLVEVAVSIEPIGRMV